MVKMGRPPLPKGERLARLLHIRLSKAEYLTISAAANKLGLSVSKYARKKLLE